MSMGRWDQNMTAEFCEGKLYPYLVPHFYEFFSAWSGLILSAIAIFGLLQPRIEVILKEMYGGIFVSGVGTFMLHDRRIVAFNLADVYPLLITLTLGLIAFFDEVVSELWRKGGENPTIAHQKMRASMKRAALDMVFYSLWMVYLTAGLVLIAFPPIKDIFSLYFGIPYALFAIGGMIYLYLSHGDLRQDPLLQDQNHLSPAGKHPLHRNKNMLRLLLVAIGTAAVAIMWKLLDTFACSRALVWFFPHPLFHILLTYSTHCVICFLGYYRGNNLVQFHDSSTQVVWVARFLPRLVVSPRQQVDVPVAEVKDGEAALLSTTEVTVSSA